MGVCTEDKYSPNSWSLFDLLLTGLTWQGISGVCTASVVTAISPPFRRIKSKCFLRFFIGMDSGRRVSGVDCMAESDDVDALAAIMSADTATSTSVSLCVVVMIGFEELDVVTS